MQSRKLVLSFVVVAFVAAIGGVSYWILKGSQSDKSPQTIAGGLPPGLQKTITANENPVFKVTISSKPINPSNPNDIARGLQAEQATDRMLAQVKYELSQPAPI